MKTSHRHAAPHRHDVGLDESFDFINTLELENGAPVDRLVSPEEALGWLVAHGVLHEDDAGRASASGAQRSLVRVRDVRAALREIADAVAEGRSPDTVAIDRVNEVLRAREVIQLELAGPGITVGHRHVGDPIEDALARLAEPVVHELAEGRPERLRVCANDRCRWVFYDASPAGRRRWCSMASCGNRAKAARHRARIRGAAGTAGTRSS